ncbi:MAG TPA: S41 family peptidase [Rhodanobacteraceae bacterium]|nr:S41 family peptidase [Rhodanobacteraceae bacterium]
MRLRHVLVSSALLALVSSAASAAGTRLLRFPDVCGQRVVFTYAGDLWTVPTEGGTAIRITAGPGLERSARFSPDCSTIAFTGEYGGGDQVFTVPAGGGEPAQLTFYPAIGPLPQRWGYDNQVYGWTPDGSKVLFRSWRDARNESSPRLYTVAASGGLPVALPMPVAGVGRYSPDGKQLVYSPKFRDFRDWDRYVGGWAQDLFIYDFAGRKATNITNDRNTDRDPVWIGNAIYFLSDRDNHLNLYRYDTAGGKTTQLTHYKDDARWASGDAAGRIVYEVGGTLHLYDTRSNADHALDISVPSDKVATRAHQQSVKKYVEDFALSGNGKRALFVARGDVFSVPLEHGITLDLTHTPGAHEREASFSRDGRRIAYISDQSGEEQIWVRDADGSNARQLTHGNMGRLWHPLWSPDGKHIAFTDKDSRIRIVATSGGQSRIVADDVNVNRGDYAWSAGGHYLAYTLTNPDNRLPQVHIYDLASGKSARIDDSIFDSAAPAFSPDGKYLYFLADREWAPQLSGIEWNFAASRSTGIYAVALRPDVENPFAPRNDTAVGGDDDKHSGKGGSGHGDKDKQTPEPSAVNDHIDFQGLAGRMVRAPIPADNIRGLTVTPKALVYVVHGAPYYGRSPARKPTVMAWSFKQRKADTVYEGSRGFDVSADGGTLLVHGKKGYQRIDLTEHKPKPKSVSLDGLTMRVEPKAEYVEIFNEVWRRYRDYFFAPNMNGYDWEALRAKYQPLLADVGDRTDLNYVLGQMIAELSNSHTYVSGGDLGLPDKPDVGLLGARFELDAASGRYRIARIMQGENDEPRYRSPLTELGVDVREGDYVLAINGKPLKAPASPYQLLRIAPDQLVQLLVNSRPTTQGARTVLVKPIDDEQPLIYYAWVKHNRDYVAKASGGTIGYLHLPDMGADGIREFIKWYYPQIHKQGLVIDVRDNGGGNVSSMILERLSRKLLGVTYMRGSDLTGTYPSETFIGHMAALCNGTTASDGDIFSAMFKRANLGPLIGTRTWGGVVGIGGLGSLIDGGTVFVPQFFAAARPTGEYAIEGEGVEPDIVVHNDVADLLAGRDPQLDRAIAEVQKAIKAQPVALPKRPPPPVKAPPGMRP